MPGADENVEPYRLAYDGAGVLRFISGNRFIDVPSGAYTHQSSHAVAFEFKLTGARDQAREAVNRFLTVLERYLVRLDDERCVEIAFGWLHGDPNFGAIIELWRQPQSQWIPHYKLQAQLPV